MRLIVITDQDGNVPPQIERLADAAKWTIIAVAQPGMVKHELTMTRIDAVIAHMVDNADDIAYLSSVVRDVPVFAWLAYRTPERIARLLQAGAHDVFFAGMEPVELAARLKRFAPGEVPADQPQIDVTDHRLAADASGAAVTWDGKALKLSGRERAILITLMRSPGTVLRREVIYRQVWGYSMVRGDRVVDVNIRRIRLKLKKKTDGAVRIVTHTGVGYSLEVDDDLTDDTTTTDQVPAESAT